MDVSIIARAQGGGGHRRAAGFSTSLGLEELIPFLRLEIAAQVRPRPRGRLRRRSSSAARRTRREERSARGVLLVDKPVGPSSHAAVAAVRRALGGVKAGHGGTLDPFASGLLVVLVGAGTRIQSRLLELPKRYETVALLGARSSTGDPEGEITVTGRLPPKPPELVVGEIRQRPPQSLGGEDPGRAGLPPGEAR